MIDLKTIKNITISEGSVKKITNSSGVVLWQKQTGSSASLDVDLNNQWVASTKTLDGYKVYMSNSNKGVNNGYASMKFKFKGQPNFKLWINSYAESNYDYTIAWNMDVNYPSSNPSSNSSGVKAHTQGKQYDPTSLTAFTEVDYSNDGGEHFVVVTYRKDSSANSNDDRGYVAIKLTLISTTWVVSSTEFIKKDGKYYQKLTEVNIYEEGVTANTGNYKQGNELTVTYKQSTADDYMVTDGKMYYKKYIYVTPKDQEINTDDYIQGDYIGEATTSMKVIYVYGTIKPFYNLTTIESNTDSNKYNANVVEIYDGVREIGDEAFYDCENMRDITLPDGLISIGVQAFSSCGILTGITIPNSVNSIGDYAFSHCSKLSSITLFDNVKTIGKQAFTDCQGLTSFEIGSGITNIGDNLFQFCNSLKTITIHATTPPTLGYNAIPSNVTTIYVPLESVDAYKSANGWKNYYSKIYAIPSMKVTYTNGQSKEFTNLTSIESNTDSNKSNTREVIIYEGVAKIGDDAFNGCTYLTSITLSDSVTSIGALAFSDCSKLTNITLPADFKSIGKEAFEGCENLTTMTVNAVTPPAREYYSFSDTDIRNIYVPKDSLQTYRTSEDWNGYYSELKAIPTPAMKVTYVDGTNKIFYGLIDIKPDTDSNKSKAESVEIYDGVEHINERAFQDCTNLYYIIIPNSLNTISMISFDGCSNLKTIIIKATTPPYVGRIDDAIPNTVKTIYVPASSVNAYKSANGWSDYASKIQAIPE